LPEADALRQAHADTLLALAEHVSRDEFSGEVDLLNRLEADHANFRQAIAYYTSQGAAGLARRVNLVAALAHFWRTHGHLAEGRRELEAAIAAEGDIPPAQRAPAIKGAALLAEAQGDLDGAERLNEQVLALLRETGDLAGVADSLTGLGVIARQRGDLKTARSRHQEALDAWRRAGDAAGTAGALLDLGLIRQLEGDYGGAEPVFKESLGLFRRLGDDLGEAHALHYLGLLAMATANLPEAIEWFGESLRLWHAMSNRQMIATDFANLGEAHHLSGALDEAERLYCEALALFEALGDPRGQGFVLGQVGLLALDRGNPKEARELLRESLRLLWSAGLRGSAADALQALAEVTWRLGEMDFAATLLQTANRVREETGFVRQPVYEARYQRLLAAVGDHRPPAPPDLDQTVATVIQQSNIAALAPK
jgi:tetratricopeptide (TPR) repeat protein